MRQAEGGERSNLCDSGNLVHHTPPLFKFYKKNLFVDCYSLEKHTQTTE